MLADDHPVMLTGMRHALADMADVTIVGEANSPDALKVQLARVSCDVLLVDLLMPTAKSLDGLTFLDNVRVQHPQVRIIVVLLDASIALISHLLMNGAIGVLSKRDTPLAFQQAVRHVYHSKLYLGEALCAGQCRGERPTYGLAALTWREIEVVRMHAQGISQVEIARRLGKATQTVSLQKLNAMRKLGLKTSVELRQCLSQHGLLE